MAPRPIEVILRNVLAEVEPYFDVEKFYGRPPGVVLVGRYKEGPGTASPLERRLGELGYYTKATPLNASTWLLEVSPKTLEKPRWRVLINAGLFVATIGTTLAAGTMQRGGSLLRPADWLLGIPFSASIMAILLCHEMAHFFASMRHKVRATLPYFLPVPHPLLGTFGALIKMESPIPDRRALLDIGAAGPIAGFLVALPLAAVGLYYSDVVQPGAAAAGTIILGDSLIFQFLTNLIKGPLGDLDVTLHPLALAGWIGLWVTSVNMLPIGQLDGGHVSYALFGKYSIWVARAAFLLLIPLGFFWSGWFFWAFLILLVVRLRHPPPVDDTVGLTPGRRLVGWLAFAVAILTFIPAPIKILS
ncbi:MAG: site-2 protease family protein [Candidatus Coatesbacteria bacterium]|nr:MAG: site-2 protease family protein [Candidatus Coatesbacteria bacterium]